MQYVKLYLSRCAASQAISSETGKVIDDFTLKKAANYAPNPTARNAFLGSGFQSTYVGSFLEVRPFCWLSPCSSPSQPNAVEVALAQQG